MFLHFWLRLLDAVLMNKVGGRDSHLRVQQPSRGRSSASLHPTECPAAFKIKQKGANRIFGLETLSTNLRRKG
jgi:hypothetical protein